MAKQCEKSMRINDIARRGSLFFIARRISPVRESGRMGEGKKKERERAGKGRGAGRLVREHRGTLPRDVHRTPRYRSNT